MPSGRTEWPSVEAVVMKLLEDIGETRQFMPADMEGETIIAVLRVGGTSDRITDRAIVQIACFHESYEQASKVAERVRERLMAYNHKNVDDVPGYAEPIYLDKVTVAAAAVEVPYDDPNKRRKIARYQISMRKHLVDD